MKRVLSLFATAAILGLAACAPATSPEGKPEQTTRLTLPPMKTFAVARPAAPARSNSQLAQDFLDLSFRLESGRVLDTFSRFEGPVTLRVTGKTPAYLSEDLDRLISRLRAEANIDLTRVSRDLDANITVQTLPRAQLQRLVPQAACFVAPNVDSWAAYRRLRRTNAMDWTALRTRTKISVFMPSDVSPQETRDCLHEEIAQALGPLNDLYRLTDSVFNDDNLNAVLTGFDMLMLRAYYDPSLASGMSEAQVAARLPEIFTRLNPAGQRPGVPNPRATPPDWIDEIERALGPGTSKSQRVVAATKAIQIASSQNLRDNRLAFSHFALGRLTLSDDAITALESFLAAASIYADQPDARIQRAHIALHLAAFGLSAGQAQETLDLVNRHIGAASEGQNAALLATLLMIKAEALDLLGRSAEANAVRLDSLGWARYGFGSEDEIRARLNEIATLSPERTSG